MFRVTLINKSTLLGNRYDTQLNLIAKACDYQADHHLLPEWNRRRAQLAFSRSGHVPDDSYVMAIVDDVDQVGVLGWHEEANAGDDRPDSFILAKTILDYGAGILDGGSADFSLASVISHEYVEMLVDPDANYWAQMPNGDLVALETADPVEAQSYPINVDGVDVLVS